MCVIQIFIYVCTYCIYILHDHLTHQNKESKMTGPLKITKNMRKMKKFIFEIIYMNIILFFFGFFYTFHVTRVNQQNFHNLT